MKKPNKKQSVKKKKAKTVKRKSAKIQPIAGRSGMEDAHKVIENRRFETRTLLNEVTFAALSLKTDAFGSAQYVFEPHITVLLVDISAGGCSLVLMKANPLSEKVVRETRCAVQIGPEAPRLATVRWVKALDSRLMNAGFAFD